MKRSFTHHALGPRLGPQHQRLCIGHPSVHRVSIRYGSLPWSMCQAGMLLHQQSRGYNVRPRLQFTALASANQGNPSTSGAGQQAAPAPSAGEQQALSDEYEEEYETEEDVVTDESAAPSANIQQQKVNSASTTAGNTQGASAGAAQGSAGSSGSSAGGAVTAATAGAAGLGTTKSANSTPPQSQASAQPASSTAAVTAGKGTVQPTRPAPVVHQVVAAPLPLASLSTPITPAASQLQATVGGWVTAAALLAAIRISRAAAEDERLDARALQLRQGESRLQSAELREKRRAYLEAERAAREAEAVRRVAEARKKSEEEAAARAAREAEYREMAKKETARLWAAQEAARQEFLAQESRMAEELAKRTAAEVRMREEAEVKRREEEARRRVMEQEAAARRAAAARARAAEEEAARQAAAAARAEEKKRIRAAQTRVSLSLDGTLAAQVPPPGTWVDRSTGQAAGSIQDAMGSSISSTSNRAGTPALPVLARMRVQITSSCSRAELWPPASSSTSDSSTAVSSPSGGSRPPPVPLQTSDVRQSQVSRLYESADVAVEETATLAVTSPTFSDVRMWLQRQSQKQQGVALDTLELEHWRRLCLCQWAAAAERTAAQVVPLAGAAEPLEQTFTVTLSRAILPHDHYASMRGRMADAAAAVAQGLLKEAVDMVDRALEEEEDMLVAVAGQGGLVMDPAAALTEVLPPLALPALVYAHLMDRGAAAAGVDVAAWHAALASPPGSSNSNIGGGARTDGSDTDSSSDGAASNGQGGVTNRAGSPGSGSEGGGETSDGSFQRSPSPSPEAQGLPEASWGPEASSLQEQYTSLARYQLELRTKGVGLDELAPTARVVALALGPRHPVAQIVSTLAQRNQSVATRLKLEARKQQREADAAAAMLKAQLPGQLALDPSSPSSRKAMIPVPERLWAVRNVALKLVRFGSDPSQVTEALSMLEGAVDLAEGHYGAGHPSCLSPLLDLLDALGQLSTSSEEADGGSSSSNSGGRDGAQRRGRSTEGVASSALDIVSSICDKFKSQGDALSLVLLAEAAARELGPWIPRSEPRLQALQRESADAFYALSPAEARVAMARRSGSGSSPLRALAREFAEEPGVYAASRRGPSRVEQWARGLKLAPLR